MTRSQRIDVRLLTAYLERELTPSECAAVEAALQRSAEARRLLASLKEGQRLLGPSANEFGAIDLTDRVIEAVRFTPTTEPSRPWRWRAVCQRLRAIWARWSG